MGTELVITTCTNTSSVLTMTTLFRYFPDGQGGKPWSDQGQHAVNDFWNARNSWLPTWNGEAAALKIDSIKVWGL